MELSEKVGLSVRMGSPPRGRGWRARVRDSPDLLDLWVEAVWFGVGRSLVIVRVYVGEFGDWRTAGIFRSYDSMLIVALRETGARGGPRNPFSTTENDAFFGVGINLDGPAGRWSGLREPRNLSVGCYTSGIRRIGQVLVGSSQCPLSRTKV